MTDQSLIGDARKGDRAALDELIRRNAELIRDVIATVHQDAEAAERMLWLTRDILARVLPGRCIAGAAELKDEMRVAAEDAALRDWVVAARKRDPAAFTHLVHRFRVRVRGVARCFVFGSDEVEDAEQEIWANVWSGIQTFDPDRGYFISWLRRVARNVALKYHNAQRMTSPPVPTPPDPKQSLPPREFLDALLALALDCGASAHEVVLFGLNKLLGYKPAEIVSNFAYRPMAELAEMFEEEYVDRALLRQSMRCRFAALRDRASQSPRLVDLVGEGDGTRMIAGWSDAVRLRVWRRMLAQERDFLLMTFGDNGPAHELLSFAHTRLLRRTAKSVWASEAPNSLSTMLERFCETYSPRSRLSPDAVRECTAALTTAMAHRPRPLKPTIGATRLCDYSQHDGEGDVAVWRDTVQRRVFLRAGDLIVYAYISGYVAGDNQARQARAAT